MVHSGTSIESVGPSNPPPKVLSESDPDTAKKLALAQQEEELMSGKGQAANILTGGGSLSAPTVSSRSVLLGS